MNFKIAACASVETQLFPTHLAKACCDNGFRILDMATGSRIHCERFFLCAACGLFAEWQHGWKT